MPEMSDRGPARASCIFSDVVLISLFATAMWAANLQSTALATLAALLLSINTGKHVEKMQSVDINIALICCSGSAQLSRYAEHISKILF
jgi:hypothetical protein